MSNDKLISIVAPVYNEEEVIDEFYKRVRRVIDNLDFNYEMIFIDDGSSDSTLEILCDIAKNDKGVKIISFSRNFGHMISLSAGLDYALGEAVITLDSDLQHPPELIPKLIKKWREGADIVNTLRKETRDIGLVKKISAKLFYWLINKISKISIRPNTADFRLLDRKVIDTLKNMKEHSRFMRGLISWMGYRQEFIDYQADRRFSGKTKYSIFHMFSFALDAITSFSALPLRMATLLGFIVAFFSFLYILYAVYMKFFGEAIAGWASVLIAVLFMGGVQLIFLGVIGEYLYRVYDETKNRPLYVIKKKVRV